MLTILTALPCETAPLVDHLDLGRHERLSRFPVYAGTDIRLVQCGVGKRGVQAAVNEVVAEFGEQSTAWLNVGVGGAPHRCVGDAVLANKVIDAACGDCWYPTIPGAVPCDTDVVVTVAQPESSYPDDAIYDMEAAGFYAAACKHSVVDLVHVVKIVSDGPQHPISSLTAESIAALIHKKLGVLDTLVSKLLATASVIEKRTAPPREYAECLQRLHFTFTERTQLERLLRRRQVLSKGSKVSNLPQHCTSATNLLRALELELETLTPNWLNSPQ